MGCPLLAGRGGLFGRTRAGGSRSARRCASAQATALARGRMVFRRATARTALLAAMGFFIHRRPGAPGDLFVRDPTLLVALLDMLGLALLLVGVARFVAAGHGQLLMHIRCKA